MPAYFLGLKCPDDDQNDKRSARGKYVAADGVKYDLFYYADDAAPQQMQELVKALHEVTAIKQRVRPIVLIPAADLSESDRAPRRAAIERLVALADGELVGDVPLARLLRLVSRMPAPPRRPSWELLHLETSPGGYEVVEYLGESAPLRREHQGQLLRHLILQKGMPVSGPNLRKACDYRDLGDLIAALPEFVLPLVITPGTGGHGGYALRR
jgi:hypothetical protein